MGEGEELAPTNTHLGAGPGTTQGRWDVVADRESATFGGAVLSHVFPSSPIPDSLRPVKGRCDVLPTPPEVLPSLYHKELDSTKETKRPKHVRHGWG